MELYFRWISAADNVQALNNRMKTAITQLNAEVTPGASGRYFVTRDDQVTACGECSQGNPAFIDEFDNYDIKAVFPGEEAQYWQDYIYLIKSVRKLTGLAYELKPADANGWLFKNKYFNLGYDGFFITEYRVSTYPGGAEEVFLSFGMSNIFQYSSLQIKEIEHKAFAFFKEFSDREFGGKSARILLNGYGPGADLAVRIFREFHQPPGLLNWLIGSNKLHLDLIVFNPVKPLLGNSVNPVPTWDMVKTCKRLCDEAYYQMKQNEITEVNGYLMFEGYREFGNGFRGYIFQDLINLTMIIVYTGSNDVSDWLFSDLAIIFGKLPDQVDEAESFFDYNYKKYYARGYRFVLTGHSLGGGLAQLAGYHALKTHPVLADSLSVITFNAISTRRLIDTQQVNPDRFYNFIHELDLVGNLIRQPGYVIRVRSDEAEPGQKIFVNTLQYFVNRIIGFFNAVNITNRAQSFLYFFDIVALYFLVMLAPFFIKLISMLDSKAAAGLVTAFFGMVGSRLFVLSKTKPQIPALLIGLSLLIVFVAQLIFRDSQPQLILSSTLNILGMLLVGVISWRLVISTEHGVRMRKAIKALTFKDIGSVSAALFFIGLFFYLDQFSRLWFNPVTLFFSALFFVGVAVFLVRKNLSSVSKYHSMKFLSLNHETLANYMKIAQDNTDSAVSFDSGENNPRNWLLIIALNLLFVFIILLPFYYYAASLIDFIRNVSTWILTLF